MSSQDVTGEVVFVLVVLWLASLLVVAVVIALGVWIGTRDLRDQLRNVAGQVSVIRYLAAEKRSGTTGYRR